MTQNSCAPQENVLTFRDLESLIYKWQIDFPDHYTQFISQNEALQLWMMEEVALRQKVSRLFINSEK